MRLLRNYLPVAGLALLAAVPALAASDDSVLAAGVVSWDDGLVVRFQTTARAPLKEAELQGWTTGEVIGKDRISRYFVDGNRGVYFGYDLVIERMNVSPFTPAANPAPFQVKIEPLSLKPAAVRGHSTGPAPTLVRLAAYPKSKLVGDGDRLEFALALQNRPETMRLSESIRFCWHHLKLLPASNR